MPCRPATRSISSQQCLWITDEILTDAFNGFLRVSNAHSKCHTEGRRYGSNVPGPLEARRRLARRRMGMMTVGAAPPGNAEFGALFGGSYAGFDPQRDLKWKPPGFEKVKKDEHWLFPKRQRPKEKEPWELLFEAKEPERDPVQESTAAFEAILRQKKSLATISRRDLKDCLEFLQSSRDEAGSQNMLRLTQWLVLGNHNLLPEVLLAVQHILLDKLHLQTLGHAELSLVLATLLRDGGGWIEHIIPILDCLPSDVVLKDVCIATIRAIIDPRNRIHVASKTTRSYVNRVADLLQCLRDCHRLQDARHSQHEVWDAVYGSIAQRFQCSDFADHLATLTPRELSRVVLYHWVPHIAQRDNSDLLRRLSSELEVESSSDGNDNDLHQLNKLTSELKAQTSGSDLHLLNKQFPELEVEKSSDDSHLFDMPPAELEAQSYLETPCADAKSKIMSERMEWMTGFHHARLIVILARYGVPYKTLAHQLFSIYLRRDKAAELMSFVMHVAHEVKNRDYFFMPANLVERFIDHVVSRDEPNLGYIVTLFSFMTELPLSKCYSAVLALARQARTPPSHIWLFLERLTGRDVVWYQKRENKKNRLPAPHVDLVHQVAHIYADSTHITHRTAFRRVWECYRFLCDRSAHVDSRLSRAFVTAGILRPLKALVRPSTEKVRYILSIVARLEGEEIAAQLDEIVWALWQGQILPQIRRRRSQLGQPLACSESTPEKPWRQKYLSNARAIKMANRLDAKGWPKLFTASEKMHLGDANVFAPLGTTCAANDLTKASESFGTQSDSSLFDDTALEDMCASRVVRGSRSELSAHDKIVHPFAMPDPFAFVPEEVEDSAIAMSQTYDLEPTSASETRATSDEVALDDYVGSTFFDPPTVTDAFATQPEEHEGSATRAGPYSSTPVSADDSNAMSDDATLSESASMPDFAEHASWSLIRSESDPAGIRPMQQLLGFGEDVSSHSATKSDPACQAEPQITPHIQHSKPENPYPAFNADIATMNAATALKKGLISFDVEGKLFLQCPDGQHRRLADAKKIFGSKTQRRLKQPTATAGELALWALYKRRGFWTWDYNRALKEQRAESALSEQHVASEKVADQAEHGGLPQAASEAMDVATAREKGPTS